MSIHLLTVRDVCNIEGRGVLAVGDWHEDKWPQGQTVAQVGDAIELYNTLIGLGRYDDAYTLFYEHLYGAMIFRLNANRQGAELLQMLFPDGFDQLPRLIRQQQ